MLRKVGFALVGLMLMASCGHKEVKPDAGDSAATGAGNPAVESKSMAFDPQGSDSGKIPGLNTIYFDYDKAALRADAKKSLSENADWIKSHANISVQIEGHTDERGSVEYNLALGERRAKTVRQYLVGLGVDDKRMKTISYGKEKPLVQGETEQAWSKNRRANFVPISE